ncbi:uncharacterized protein G2W53_010146 [Senna tora]|uniref:Uncharacterized protein n=1 Tax=Senna tora TaxID=362788 RepID=A0A834X0E8_9FABA|nr:uncharacterized protein G2W53_010146 [Senna tora]
MEAIMESVEEGWKQKVDAAATLCGATAAFSKPKSKSRCRDVGSSCNDMPLQFKLLVSLQLHDVDIFCRNVPSKFKFTQNPPVVPSHGHTGPTSRRWILKSQRRGNIRILSILRIRREPQSMPNVVK